MITESHFKLTWEMVLMVSRTAQLVSAEDVSALLEVVQQGHALGPIVDPTLYRDGGMDNLEEQQTLAEGFLAFRRAIDKVKQMGEERSKQ